MTSNRTDQQILDHALNQFYSENDDAITFTQFSDALNQLRTRSSRKDWVRFIERLYLNHPLRDFLVQEPFTQSAIFQSKDSCNSVLMDFIYSGDGVVPAPFTGYETARGKRLHQGLMSLSSCQGIRNARKIIEGKIEEVSRHTKDARLLSIPSGRLREIQTSKADSQLAFSSLHALDLDEDALFHIQQHWGFSRVHTQQFTFLNFTRVLIELQPLDLIWSNGLLHDLEDAGAEELVTQLFDRLKPDGVLLLACLHPSHLLCGYLEVCCDWWAVYRDERELLRLAEKIVKEKSGSAKTYRDPTGSIVFLEVKKTNAAQAEKSMK